MSLFTRPAVAAINTSIQTYLSTLRGLQKAAYYGVATNGVGEMDGIRVIAPYVFDSDGEGVFVGPDDSFDFILYHRALSMSTVSKGGAFGDGTKEVRMTSNMSMIVYYNEKAVCLSPDDIFMVMASKISIPPTMGDVMGISINLGSVSFNKEDIFASEYKAVPYNLSAEQQIFRIDYTLEGTFRKDCLNIC